MILLVSASAVGFDIAKLIAESTGHRTERVPGVRAALTQLEKNPFDLAILDESLPELDEQNIRLLLKHLHSARPLFINFALSCPERILNETRRAIHKGSEEQRAARQAAERELCGQLRSDLTALHLASEPLLQAQIPDWAKDQLNRVLAAAMHILAVLSSSDRGASL